MTTHNINPDRVFSIFRELNRIPRPSHYEEEGWMKARGISLGADNGIGLSMALAVLEDDRIVHPALHQRARGALDHPRHLAGADRVAGAVGVRSCQSKKYNKTIEYES